MGKCSKHVIGLTLLMLPLAPCAETAPEPGAAGALPLAQTDNETELLSTLSRYRDKLDSLQAEHGAYHPDLSETLSGIGRTLSKLGEHREAAEAFRSAMHITRVNYGLHSLDQLPFLESLIQEYNELGDLTNARNNYLYMYWVYKRNYENNDPRLLPVIQKITKWFRGNYMHNLKDYPVDEIRRLQELSYKSIEITSTHYGDTDPRMIEPLQQYIRTNLLIARELGKQLEDRDIDTNVRDCKFGVRTHNGNEAYVNPELMQIIIERCRSYENGKLGMQHILTIYRNNHASPDNLARALVRIGDWEMMFERQRSAFKNYTHAYELLAQTDAGEERIQQLFGEPRMLTSILDSDEGNDPGEDSIKEDDVSPFAIISMDVSSSGKARNIKVLETNPSEDTDLQRAARRQIKDSIFRPRLEDGEPVDTIDYKVTYIQTQRKEGM